MRFLLIAFLALAVAAPADARSRDPIRFAEGQSAAQKVVIPLAHHALKKAGFKTEVVPVPDDLVAALADGRVHAHPAVIVADQPALAMAIDVRSVRSLGGLEGNRPDEAVMKIVWPGMKKKWADAQKMLKRMVLPAADVTAMAAEVEAGTTPEDVANAWWKANKKRWSPWIAASKNWMKP